MIGTHAWFLISRPRLRRVRAPHALPPHTPTPHSELQLPLRLTQHLHPLPLERREPQVACRLELQDATSHLRVIRHPTWPSGGLGKVGHYTSSYWPKMARGRQNRWNLHGALRNGRLGYRVLQCSENVAPNWKIEIRTYNGNSFWYRRCNWSLLTQYEHKSMATVEQSVADYFKAQYAAALYP